MLTSVWLILIGIFMALGVFLPKFRWRAGRSSSGRLLTTTEQLLMALFFIGFGALCLAFDHR